MTDIAAIDSRGAEVASGQAATSVVDWSAAKELAAKLIPAGPRLTRDEAVELVSGLRAAADASVLPILETTRMAPAPGLPPDRFGQVLVVDRANWAASNIDMMARLSDPVLAAVSAKIPMNNTARLGAGAEVAAMMGILSPRVLGQFDPYSAMGKAPSAVGSVDPSRGANETTAPPIPSVEERSISKPRDTDWPHNPPVQQGQLMLIAPNVAQVERQLKVDPEDFRLWVCLHEQTHGLQFAAAPWLAPYMYGQISSLLDALTQRAVESAEASFWQKFVESLKVVRDLTRGLFRGTGPAPFELLLGAEQQEKLSTITAVMALLEGHADVMMDEVGPAVVPSVTEIREKFEARRDGEGQPRGDVALRKIMGMDAKLAQYRDGAKFVRGVEELVGRDGFNAVWASPETLPRAGEIEEPKKWVKRIHG